MSLHKLTYTVAISYSFSTPISRGPGQFLHYISDLGSTGLLLHIIIIIKLLTFKFMCDHICMHV